MFRTEFKMTYRLCYKRYDDTLVHDWIYRRKRMAYRRKTQYPIEGLDGVWE